MLSVPCVEMAHVLQDQLWKNLFSQETILLIKAVSLALIIVKFLRQISPDFSKDVVK